MTKPVHTRTFKSGNSVAVRLPRALGIGPNEAFAISRRGDTITARRLPSPEEEAQRLERFRTMLEELRRLGPVGEIEEREASEFPERPGL